MTSSTGIRFAITLAMIIITLTAVTTVFAHTNKFCIRAGEYEPGGFAYEDRNVGDWWVSTASRPLRGVRMRVKNNGVQIFIGNADQSGCTPNLNMTQGTFQLDVYSWGYPLYPLTSTTLQVKNSTFGGPIYEVRTMNGSVGSSWTKVVDPLDGTKQDIWFLYAAAAETLHNEPVPGTFKIYYDATTITAGTIGGITYIGQRSARVRFTIAHELGHQYMDLANEALINSASYSETGCISNCPETCKSGNTFAGGTYADCHHKLTSNEYMTAAMTEGWAHYVAALIWNTTANCYFPEFDSSINGYAAVNCRYGTPGYPINYIRYKCEPSCTTPGSAACLNHGVPLDWLRTFWRTNRTQNCGGTIPAWLDVFANPGIGANLNACNAFERLDLRVAGTPFEACWTSAADNNGINRPSGTCQPPACVSL